MSAIPKAIAATEQLLARSADPGMQAILAQLRQAGDGRPMPHCSIGRILSRNYEPAPTDEIESWIDMVTQAWKEIRQRNAN